MSSIPELDCMRSFARGLKINMNKLNDPGAKERFLTFAQAELDRAKTTKVVVPAGSGVEIKD